MIGIFLVWLGIILFIATFIKKLKLIQYKKTFRILAIIFFVAGSFIAGIKEKPTPPKINHHEKITETKQNKKELPNIPKINAEQYPEHSPERALANYLLCWQKQDWNKILDYTQITWVSESTDPTESIKNHCLGRGKLLGASEIKRVGGTPYMAQVTAIIYYKWETDTFKQPIKANVICESAPYTPNLGGKWGVNPISIVNIGPPTVVGVKQ
ncbi:MAG: hypothetical protein J7K33_03700 [Candidatus Marinimicrobia bacterium]|nr:hypothetical protein [Candidatus Neomarinimicrobiota bacterium]